MNVSSFAQIDRFLDESGLMRFQNQLPIVMEAFSEYLQGTQRVILGQVANKFFPCYDSVLGEINIDIPNQHRNLQVGYVVDFGGTNTRIVKFAIENGLFKCISVDRIANDKLQQSNDFGKKYQPIVECFKEVVKIIIQLANNNPQAVEAISIIWSNASVASKLSGSVIGVTNKVCGINNGKDYLKKEWFTKDLYDGQDLGQLFLAQCESVGIRLKKLVMGNDTVFVGLAADGACAAGVISTGANMASLMATPSAKDNDSVNKSSKQMKNRWYNLECGTNFYVDKNIVSNLLSDQIDLSIQSLIAGGWFLERYFQILSEVFVSIGISEQFIKTPAMPNAQWFNKLFKYSCDLQITTSELSSAINNHEITALISELFKSRTYSPIAGYCVLRLANIIAQRVIALSSVMIAGSVLSYQNSSVSKVLMDSRVLEGLDPNLNITNNYLSLLSRPNIKIELIKEDNSKVGAGVIGAARALSCINLLE